MNYNVISTDSHVAPGDLWKPRVSAGLRERIPARQGQVSSTLSGLGQMAGRNFKDFTNKPVSEGETRPGNYDPVEFLKDQVTDGVDAHALYAAGGFPGPDREVRLASFRAHNDWLIEDFCSADPKRLLGLAPIPQEDGVDAAVEEVRRSARKGHKGGVLNSHPTTPYYYPDWEPLWAVAEELDFPLHIHRAGGPKIPDGMNVDEGGGPTVGRIVLRFTAAKEAVTYILFSGAFHRHPGLSLVSAESDFGWLPFFMQCCDDMYTRQRHWAGIDFGRMPSEILREQLYCTFMDDMVGIANLQFTGTDNVMWASDYPHSTSTWPNSQDYIHRQMDDLPSETKYKLLAGNAMRLYHLADG